MKSIWHSLAWKEWHEHKWKLAAITLVLWGVTSVAFLEKTRDVFPIMWGMMLLGLVPMAIFVGLGAAAYEQSRGTLRFLQALPVPMWRVALHKLAFGLLTLIAPALLTVLLICAWWVTIDYGSHMGSPRPSGVYLTSALQKDTIFVTGNWLSDIAIMAILLAGSLFLWCAAAGVNRKDEVSAGAIALPAMAGYWLLLVALWGVLLLWSTSDETVPLRAVAAATAPGGVLMVGGIGQRALWPMLLGFVAATVAHGLLAARYVRGFGYSFEREVGSPQAATQIGEYGWLAPPRRSPLAAIAWKQLRESGPIVLAGVAGILLTVTAIIAVTVAVYAMSPEPRVQAEPREVFRIYAGISLVFGIIIGMVAGIGVALHDTEPRLNAFWRSRPIQPDVWFWSKFFTGLAILLVALYIPLVFVAWLAQLHTLTIVWSPDDFVYPLVHSAVFAAAVAMTCLVRHAVYAAILSIPLVYLGLVLVWLANFAAALAGWRAWPVAPLYDMTEGQAAVGLIVSFVISTLLAWSATRYDWGRKSRY